MAKLSKLIGNIPAIDSYLRCSNAYKMKPKAYQLNETQEISVINQNHNGQQIASDKALLTKFWDWFDGSATVDDKGRPIVFYHGSPYKFDKFKYCVITPAVTSDNMYVNVLLYSDTNIYVVSYTKLERNVNIATGEIKKEGTWECIQTNTGEIGIQTITKTTQENLYIPNAYGKYIAKFFININLPAGTKIYIYGVRA